MEIFIATCLIVAGLAIGLLGLKLFKAMLPIAGLMVGATIGFTGIQGIFGTGVTSTTIAILTACIFGLVMAVLSYSFFDIALVILVALGMSSLLTLFGVALGLSENGFVLFMLSLAGFIIGLHIALSAPLPGSSLVTLATSLVGMGFVMAGIFLIGSSVSMESLGSKGVIATVAERVSDSFWWIFVWIAGAVIMRVAQLRTAFIEAFPEHLGYTHAQKNSK